MKIFSGIQPTGDKHLGNLFGGFRQYAATQEQGEAFFCIVDLHSITVDYDPDDLRTRTYDLAAMLFATGSTRSARPSSARATCRPTPRRRGCSRRDQLRAAGPGWTCSRTSRSDADFISAGLFTYPVLMAGDILLYQTDIVRSATTSASTSSSPGTSPSGSTHGTGDVRSSFRQASTRRSGRGS